MTKIKYDDLYVASEVFVYGKWEDFSPGAHEPGYPSYTVHVSQKRRLLYAKLEQDGDIGFFDYITGKKVSELNHTSSFKGVNYSNSGRDYAQYDINCRGGMGYFIPFDQYMLERFGKRIDSITPASAYILLKFTNFSQGRPISLSFNKEEAKIQLENIIGYRKNSGVKKR